MISFLSDGAIDKSVVMIFLVLLLVVIITACGQQLQLQPPGKTHHTSDRNKIDRLRHPYSCTEALEVMMYVVILASMIPCRRFSERPLITSWFNWREMILVRGTSSASGAGSRRRMGLEEGSEEKGVTA